MKFFTPSIRWAEQRSQLYGDKVTDEVRRGFMNWSFLHGLAFILKDEQLKNAAREFDIDNMLRDNTRRVLINIDL